MCLPFTLRFLCTSASVLAQVAFAAAEPAVVVEGRAPIVSVAVVAVGTVESTEPDVAAVPVERADSKPMLLASADVVEFDTLDEFDVAPL